MCDVTEVVKRKNGNAEARRTLRLFYLEVVVVAVLCGLAVWTLRSTSLSLRSYLLLTWWGYDSRTTVA
jgi:hypothetical protein